MTTVDFPLQRPAFAAVRRPWTSWTADSTHGPLPALLLILTVVTGLVDAVSILALGRVFVANMTGNVVFIAFGLAGAPGFSVRASLAGLAGFLVGAALGGWFNQRLDGDRARLLAAAVTVEFALFAVTTALLTVDTADGWARVVSVAVLAVGTGLQNAVVRKLAVPDLTTTVLTMTLTGLAADLRHRRHGPTFGRRLLAVIAMVAGAFVGAVLVSHDGPAPGLLIATVLLAGVAAAAARSTRRPAGWRNPPAAPTPRPAEPAGQHNHTDAVDLHARHAELEAQPLDAVKVLPASTRHPDAPELSARQVEVLAKVIEGANSEDIARSLFLSPSTVRNHLTTIYRKFGVQSRSALLARLLREAAYEDT